jgi:hypothetical protein
MADTGKAKKQSPVDERDRSERLSQIRHLQTLRWAYLSTYLAGLGWFLSMYFDKNSTLGSNDFAILLCTSGLGILGIFVGLRVMQYTRIIRHDLVKIGTSVRGIGWLEYVFIFIITAVVFAFGLLSFFGIL